MCNLKFLFVMVVHYKAWAEKTLHKFEDTWLEQRPFELVLGKGMYNALG